METKSQILQKLSDSLTSTNWQRLKNAVIGKELLAIGSEIIYATEQVALTILNNLNPNYTDYPSLIVLATANDVAVSNIEPSWIRVKLPETSTQNFYKPFDLQFKSGSFTFTNVDYCRAGEEVTLYQGNVVFLTDDTDLASSNFMNFRTDSTGILDLQYLPTSNVAVQTFYPLSSQVLPQSVYFCKRETQSVTDTQVQTFTKIIPKFTPLEYSSDKECFKLRTLADGKIVLLLGDGNWGKELSGTGYCCYYLQLTSNPFTTSGQVKYNQTTVEGCQILASHQGSTNNLEYAKQSYFAELRSRDSLVSVEQIKGYVNTLPYVQDSYVFTTEGPTLNVYWKPKDKNEVMPTDVSDYPGDLLSTLYAKSIMGANMHVQIGNKVEVQFAIESSSVPDNSIRNQIGIFLLDQYAYDKLSYDFRINIASVSGQIQSAFGVNAFVSFSIQQLRTVNPDTAVSMEYNTGFSIIPGTFYYYLSETGAAAGGDIGDGNIYVGKTANGNIIGTIDYNSGIVKFSSVRECWISFRSFTFLGDDKSYIVLNESNPVIWYEN